MQNKLLIIEDDPSICELLELFLTGHNFTTFFAKDGYEGLLLFEQEHPNLVLLDLMLPRIDGIQTCRDIRKISNVPIIFISCKKDSLDIMEALFQLSCRLKSKRIKINATYMFFSPSLYSHATIYKMHDYRLQMNSHRKKPKTRFS